MVEAREVEEVGGLWALRQAHMLVAKGNSI